MFFILFSLFYICVLSFFIFITYFIFWFRVGIFIFFLISMQHVMTWPRCTFHSAILSLDHMEEEHVFLLGVWLGCLVLVSTGIIRPLYTTPCEYHTTWRRPVYTRLFFPIVISLLCFLSLLLIIEMFSIRLSEAKENRMSTACLTDRDCRWTVYPRYNISRKTGRQIT